MTKYAIEIFYNRKTGCHVAETPDLPLEPVYGDTEEEALMMMKEAIDVWRAEAKREGRRVHDPGGKMGANLAGSTEENLMSEDDDEQDTEPPWLEQFEFLWVLAILTFGFGDIITTGWAIQNGAQEANPFLHDIVHGNFGLFIFIKGLLLAVAYLYSHFILVADGHDGRFMPVVFILAGLFLMASNIMVTLGLIGALSEIIMASWI